MASKRPSLYGMKLEDALLIALTTPPPGKATKAKPKRARAKKVTRPKAKK